MDDCKCDRRIFKEYIQRFTNLAETFCETAFVKALFKRVDNTGNNFINLINRSFDCLNDPIRKLIDLIENSDLINRATDSVNTGRNNLKDTRDQCKDRRKKLEDNRETSSSYFKI